MVIRMVEIKKIDFSSWKQHEKKKIEKKESKEIDISTCSLSKCNKEIYKKFNGRRYCQEHYNERLEKKLKKDLQIKNQRIKKHEISKREIKVGIDYWRAMYHFLTGITDRNMTKGQLKAQIKIQIKDYNNLFRLIYNLFPSLRQI
mgnify:CR=1 FL=1